jgi:putative selenium metabolism protein SsnA
MYRIIGGTILTFDEERPVVSPGALVVKEHEIIAIDTPESINSRFPEAEEIQAQGCVIIPGLIDGHQHLYRSLGMGMPKNDLPADFVQLQEATWWRMEKLLDAEDISAAARLGALEALKRGTTTVFDQHCSPGAVEGSLSRIAEATSELGLRACLSYEVSDRGGKAGAKAGMEENERFIRQWRSENNPFVRALIGLQSSFSVNNQTMEKARNLCEKYLIGFHVRVAEDNFDLQDSLLKYEERVVQRLHDMGILGEWTVAAHGVFVDEHEMDILHNTQTFLAHCPRSNMFNAVGTANVPEMFKRGVLVGLGTTGFGYSLLDEMAVLPMLHRGFRKMREAFSLRDAVDLLFRNNPVIVQRIFGIPVGKLMPGSAADLVMLRYDPPVPLRKESLEEQLLFSICSHPQVDSVMVHGRWMVQNGQLLTGDEQEIRRVARQRAGALWERFKKESGNGVKAKKK